MSRMNYWGVRPTFGHVFLVNSSGGVNLSFLHWSIALGASGAPAWVDPGRMNGVPRFRGSRLPVQKLFDWLADGVSLEDFVS